MVVLALETSGKVCGAAVSIDGSLVATTEIIRDASHDSYLPDVVQSTLRCADVSLDAVDIVALSAGPGSFTGLRIGASFVKGLTFSGSPKLLPVPTLTSIHVASQEVALLSGATHILSVVPSHRDLWYVQVAPCASSLRDHTVRVCSTEDTMALINERTFVAGPGAERLAPTAVSGLTRLSARFVAFASWKLLEEGVQCVDVDAFVPAYQQEFVPR